MLNEKAEKIKKELGAFAAVTADLSDMTQTRGLYNKTGPVDCLILNASVQVKQSWQEITEEALDNQINVNIKSTLVLMQAYYPAMKEKGFGRIVTIGSVNQHRCHPMLSIYSATKCAVMRLVKNIAEEAAPYGVTVNNVSPGAIATPRNADVFNDVKLRAAVESAIHEGMEHFICGMAEGCDLYFAETMLALKSTYPHITLEAAIPCPSQADGWGEAQKSRYRDILARCDYDTMVQQRYTPGCMQPGV